METNNSIQSRPRSGKKGKNSKIQKAGIKVVYISNPMKVKTSAAEFRALVQELTGQDAEFPDPSKFSPPAATVPDDDDDDPAAHNDAPKMMMMMKHGDDHHNNDINDHADAVALDDQTATMDSSGNEQPESSGSTSLYDPTSFISFDDDTFMPQMLDNISGVFPPALYCHSPH